MPTTPSDICATSAVTKAEPPRLTVAELRQQMQQLKVQTDFLLRMQCERLYQLNERP